MRGEIQDKENIHSDHEEGSKSADEEEIDVETVTEEQSTIEEEPVSPPPCNPEEAPTLLQSLSKTIEKIAVEVVDENQLKFQSVHCSRKMISPRQSSNQHHLPQAESHL